MKTSLPLIQLVIISLGLLVSMQAFGGEVSVRHADLTLTLPDRPEKDVTKIGGDGPAERLQHRLIIKRPNGTIIVWYQDSPGIADPATALQAARDSVVRMSKGEVKVDKKVTAQENPGRYFVVTIPEQDGEFRVAYYFANGKTYQVMAVGTKDFTQNPSMDRMFKSVKFAKR